MLKKVNLKNVIGLHVLFWLIVIILYYIDYEPITVYRTLGVDSFFLQTKAWGMAFWNSLTCLPVSYINLILISYFEKQNVVKTYDIGFKIAYFLIIAPILASISAYLVHQLLLYLTNNYIWLFFKIYDIQFKSTANESEIWYRNVPETVFIMVGLFGLLAITVNRSLEKEKKFLEKEKEILELRINLLRRRMQPHFIIGVLNTIFHEVNNKIPKVGVQIDLLSSLLRYVLKENDQREVLLKDEVDFVRNYIILKKLEQTNKDVEIIDRMILTDFPEDRKIMPLMLVELIENAFKYSYNAQGKRYINIYLYADDFNNICIRVENKRPIEKHRIEYANTTKEGIKNLKQRLDLTYPNAYDFNILENDPTQYTVFLTIKKTQ